MINQAELLYFTGTEKYHLLSPMHKLINMICTDGVKHIADNGGQHGAYWLLDAIASYQIEAPMKGEPFQHWKLAVKDSKAVLTGDDGNENILVTQEIEFTDFDLPEISFYLVDDGRHKVLMLPSEY